MDMISEKQMKEALIGRSIIKVIYDTSVLEIWLDDGTYLNIPVFDEENVLLENGSLIPKGDLQ